MSTVSTAPTCVEKVVSKKTVKIGEVLTNDLKIEMRKRNGLFCKEVKDVKPRPSFVNLIAAHATASIEVTAGDTMLFADIPCSFKLLVLIAESLYDGPANHSLDTNTYITDNKLTMTEALDLMELATKYGLDNLKENVNRSLFDLMVSTSSEALKAVQELVDIRTATAGAAGEKTLREKLVSKLIHNAIKETVTGFVNARMRPNLCWDSTAARATPEASWLPRRKLCVDHQEFFRVGLKSFDEKGDNDRYDCAKLGRQSLPQSVVLEAKRLDNEMIDHYVGMVKIVGSELISEQMLEDVIS